MVICSHYGGSRIIKGFMQLSFHSGIILIKFLEYVPQILEQQRYSALMCNEVLKKHSENKHAHNGEGP